MTEVLAYLLWHTPAASDPRPYERGLATFHRALAAAPPAGFVRSWTLRVEQPAWLPDGPAHYLDWYLIESYTALGQLNDGAVSGTRRAAHDDVAALVRTGTAGLLGLVGGVVDVPAAPTLGLLDKPPGQSYATFRPALAAAAEAVPGTGSWMRQMTFGPGPEFFVLGPAGALPPLPAPVTELGAAIVATS